MKLIVGLGNPGPQYTHTRHNIGFVLLDYLLHNPSRSYDKKHKAEIVTTRIYDHKVLGLKPQTYMNLSGQSVQSVSSFFRINPSDILVIHDEIDLAVGTIKHKQGGGHAGHNGLRDISQKIGPDYHRIRIGVGRPSGPMSVSDYVLGKYTDEEDALIHQTRQSIGKNMMEEWLRG